EIVDETHSLAKVEVGGVRRNINCANCALLDDVRVGDYVLIHVGFAMSKKDEDETQKTLALMRELGMYEPEMEQIKTSEA
ncbi:MAG: HypC/HybG/HupF family hydrogenase formation chaperone, partial [Blastocatellia bacterium]